MSRWFWVKQMDKIIDYLDNSEKFHEIIDRQLIGAGAFQYWYDQANIIRVKLIFTSDELASLEFKQCLTIQTEFNYIRKELEKWNH